MNFLIEQNKEREFGSVVDFGRTASDYARYRQGFPAQWFDTLIQQKIIKRDDRVLDLGTGTGSIARGLALRGLVTVGLDPSEALIEQARNLDAALKLETNYIIGKAEKTGLPSESFDVITAGQCWHWFKATEVTQECLRLLAPGGSIIISHFDWLPLQGNVVEATEKLILKFNPQWPMSGGTGLYPRWLTDLAMAGFRLIRTFSFDTDVAYKPEAWRGRIRASAGVKASLLESQVEEFDSALEKTIKKDFPEEILSIPHRCWTVIGLKPV